MPNAQQEQSKPLLDLNNVPEQISQEAPERIEARKAQKAAMQQQQAQQPQTQPDQPQAQQQQGQQQQNDGPMWRSVWGEIKDLTPEERHSKLLQKDDSSLDGGLLKEKYNLAFFSAARLQGKAPAEKYLVDGTFTMGAAHLLAADGGLGKGMLLLELAVNVAKEKPDLLVSFCGRTIQQQNRPAVIIAAEDSLDDFHRRLDSMGLEKPKNLFLVALPNCAGGSALFKQAGKGEYKKTQLWNILYEQLCHNDLKPALIVFDPLSALVELESDTDSAGMAFFSKNVAALAQQSGACVIVTHHVRKSTSNEGLRGTIKGSVALVNGLRSASVLWEPDETTAKRVCATLHEKFEPERIVKFKSVKGNFPRIKSEETLLRDPSGRLIAISETLRNAEKYSTEQLEEILIEAIKDAAEKSCPFKYSGNDGLYQQRGDLPAPFNQMTRDPIQAIAKKLLSDGRIVKGSQKNKNTKVWLDVPDGPVARGEFEKMAEGSRKNAKKPEDPDQMLKEASAIYDELFPEDFAASETSEKPETVSETDAAKEPINDGKATAGAVSEENPHE